MMSKLQAAGFTEAQAAALLAVFVEKPVETVENSWPFPNFEESEFRCTCSGRGCDGFPVKPKLQLVEALQKVRTETGRAVVVTSGVRCNLRNSELPGSAANSYHKKGRAADFVVSGITAANTISIIKRLKIPYIELYAIDGSAVHMAI